MCSGVLATCLIGFIPSFNNVAFASAPENNGQDVGLFPLQKTKAKSPASGQSQSTRVNSNQQRVDLLANEIIYDEANQLILAKGNVEIVQGKEVLRADTVRYDLTRDFAEAIGNVALLQENGDIHFAQRVEFQQKLKEGFVEELYSYISDGARFTASKGQQIESGNRIVMRNASYTPCIPCESDPDTPMREQLTTQRHPAWAIKADKVIHDKQEKQIIYRDARFNFYGVPLLYTPFFSHPDGSVTQKSGFLTPSFGFDSDLGANITSRYYWAIDKDKDTTFGVMIPTNEPPLFLAEYRQRFENAFISLEGSATSSDRIDEVSGVKVERDESFRGHLFGKGLWNINRHWRAGFDLERSSDDQFLREYNITGEDVLETEVYAERFEERDYFSVRSFGFQDRRIIAEDVDQPNIIPEITYSKMGAPGSILGGRVHVDASLLGLQREGEGQDLTRAVLQGTWRRQFIFPFGLVSDTRMLLRGDFYNVRDRDFAKIKPSENDHVTQGRGFAQWHNIFRMPFARNFDNGNVIIEPIAALTLAPDIDQREEDIPNEDSQDIELDINGLFNANRFSGEDRIEDKSRVTYGLNAGVYTDDGSRARIFIGQSSQFDDTDIIFPEGSGLSEKDSDVVGRLGIEYQHILDLNYNFQLDNDSLAAQRHEITAGLSILRFQTNNRYFFSKGLENTSVEKGREQLQNNTYLWLDNERRWLARSGFTMDFAENEGLRRAYLGLNYTNKCRCWNLSFTGIRNLTAEASGESSTEFLVQIGFKNLGAFGNTNLSSN